MPVKLSGAIAEKLVGIRDEALGKHSKRPKQVWLKYHKAPKGAIKMRGNLAPSLSYVEKVLKKYPESQEHRAPWKPWGTVSRRQGGSPEGFAHILALDNASKILFGRSLDVDEARWVRDLRMALEGLSLYWQLCFVHEYTERKRVAEIMDKEDFDVSDLDAMVAFRPWLHAQAEMMYEQAVTGGFVPPPLVYMYRAFAEAETNLPFWEIAKEMLYQFPARGFANMEDASKGMEGKYITEEMMDYFGVPKDYIPSEVMQRVLEIKTLDEQQADEEQGES